MTRRVLCGQLIDWDDMSGNEMGRDGIDSRLVGSWTAVFNLVAMNSSFKTGCDSIGRLKDTRCGIIHAFSFTWDWYHFVGRD